MYKKTISETSIHPGLNVLMERSGTKWVKEEVGGGHIVLVTEIHNTHNIPTKLSGSTMSTAK